MKQSVSATSKSTRSTRAEMVSQPRRALTLRLEAEANPPTPLRLDKGQRLIIDKALHQRGMEDLGQVLFGLCRLAISVAISDNKTACNCRTCRSVMHLTLNAGPLSITLNPKTGKWAKSGYMDLRGDLIGLVAKVLGLGNRAEAAGELTRFLNRERYPQFETVRILLVRPASQAPVFANPANFIGKPISLMAAEIAGWMAASRSIGGAK